MKTIKRIVAITLALTLMLCSTPVGAKSPKYAFAHLKALCTDTDSSTGWGKTLFKYKRISIPLGGIFGQSFVHKKIKGEDKWQYKGIKNFRKDALKQIGALKPFHCTINYIYLTGYKNNKELKKNEWIPEKYLTKGELIIKYKKKQYKKPKIKMTFYTNKNSVDFKSTILNANQSVITSVKEEIIPNYFPNTTGKGSKKVVGNDFSRFYWYGPDGCREKTATNYITLEGHYKSIRSFTYKMNAQYYDIKISKGIPKIIKKKIVYKKIYKLHKTLSKKTKREKIKLRHEDGKVE